MRLFITLVLGFSFSVAASAATFIVTNNAETGPGSLVAAINTANATAGTSHRIEFAPSIGLIDLLQPLPIITKENLEIDASSSPGVEVAPINPSAGFRLFRVGATVDSLILRGFALRFGAAETSGTGGGCIDGEAAKATAILELDRMQISQCRASFSDFARGGAVHWSGARILAIDSVFDSNAAISTGVSNFAQASGGALYARALELTRTRLTNNQSSGRGSFGGAVFVLGNLTSLDTVWLDNQALSNTNSGSGGALAAECAGGCLHDLRRNFFGRNQSRGSGAIFASGSQFFSVLSLQNTSFIDNAASGTFSTATGALALGQQMILEARHVSFQGNTGSTAHLSAQGAQQRLIHNSIFAASSTPGCLLPSFTQAGSGNIATRSECATVTPGTTLLPAFANGPVNFDARMPVAAYGPSSPAIDQANSAECPGTDAIGSTRPQDGNGDGTAACDIGAYELVNSIFSSGFEN